MATTRPTPTGSVDSAEIAAFLSCRHSGDPAVVTGIDSLAAAGEGDLAFSVYEDAAPVRASDASVVVCPPSIGPLPGRTLLFHDRPKVAFVRAARAFLVPDREHGIHPTAVVAEGATVGRNCRIGPHAHVGPAVRIGDDCVVGAGCRLGGAGFGFVRDADGELHRQPHVGTVRIADGVELGANTTIDRAVFDETVVGRGAKLSAGVHLAHQARVGPDTTVAFGAGLAGGATLGEAVTVHPHARVATDVSVGDRAEVGMDATVLDDVPAGVTVAGTPAREL